ncbi:MAG: hypothetical protein AAF221_08295 [Pseudomonadota bacterium]
MYASLAQKALTVPAILALVGATALIEQGMPSPAVSTPAQALPVQLIDVHVSPVNTYDPGSINTLGCDKPSPAERMGYAIRLASL